jgi:hypothetical protein
LAAADSARLLSEGPVPDRYRVPLSTSEALVPAEIAPGRADIVFPIIHGTTGEDGTLQGFLQTLGLPYVGAGVTASAVGMDKAVFKALLRDAGIPTPRAVVLRHADEASSAALPPLPLFVKPACGGSSVGVTKVKRPEDLSPAVELAFRYDERVLAEEAIDARELECAVLGNENPEASVLGEIVPGHEFYDYDDKYRDDKAQLRRLGNGARGFLPGARHRSSAGQRDQHAAGVHRDLDVPEALGGERSPAPEAPGRAHPARPRAPGEAPPPADRAPRRAGVVSAERVRFGPRVSAGAE